MNYLSGPGKGVILIKLTRGEDTVLGFIASTGERDLLRVGDQSRRRADDQHRELRGDRPGGKGRELLQRGQFTRVIPPEVENPAPATGA